MLFALFPSFFYRPPAPVCVLLMLPMIIDGLVQRLTSYESNNIKRVITGFLFGYGLVVLFVLSAISTMQLGMRVGESWKQ